MLLKFAKKSHCYDYSGKKNKNYKFDMALIVVIENYCKCSLFNRVRMCDGNTSKLYCSRICTIQDLEPHQQVIFPIRSINIILELPFKHAELL